MRLPVKQLCAVFLLAASAQAEDARVAALEKKLAEAASQIAQLQSVMEALRGELTELKRGSPRQALAPSTLLDIAPEFAPAFRPGAHSAGGAVFTNLRRMSRDDVYWRYDQFNGDPVSGLNVKAFNFGYLRAIGKNSRIGIDYQFRNRVSFNDDDVNTRLQVTWNVVC